MTGSPAETADYVIPRKHRIYDLAISAASCVVFILLAGPIAGLMWFAVLLIHELGHFALGFRFTGRPPAITIYPLLGLTFAPGMNRRPTPENIAFALGGIWSSIAAALVLLPLSRANDRAFAFLGMSLAINLINALPIPGIDGGRVCQMLARSLPAPWPRVAAVAMFAFAFGFAWWLRDPVFWVILGIVTLISVAMLVRGSKWNFAPLAPGEATACLAGYALTVTVLVHLLWVLLSTENSLFRIFRGLGLAGD